ncbi:MAG TPA: hypothetical protein VEV38_05700 [Candidatus Eremiobacteraceae bacterium]|nr:hypothetical protein [Candidatus Eremiobacteraceae bacterium]
MSRQIAYALFLIVAAGCTAQDSPVAGKSDTLLAQPFVRQNGGNPVQWRTFVAPPGVSITTGSDHNIWFSGADSNMYKADILTGNTTQFPTGAIFPNDGQIALGPDGNIWFCSEFSYLYGRITPSGEVTLFQSPGTNHSCAGIVAGPDGNMWFTDEGVIEIGRIRMDGTLTEWPVPFGSFAYEWIVAGPDGNLWFAGNNGQYHSIIASITPKGTFGNEITVSQNSPVDGLTVGKDGAFYTAMIDANQIARITTAGSVRFFDIALQNPIVLYTPDKRYVYVAGFNGINLYSVRTPHTLESIGIAPSSPGDLKTLTIGYDKNIWYMTTDGDRGAQNLGVYIRRVLSVNPDTATLSVGQSTSFVIDESNCHCIWSANSSNVSVATASQVSGNTFTVTGVGAGNATIDVADQHDNDFLVEITVL